MPHIQAQQIGVGQHPPELPRLRLGVPVKMGILRVGHHEQGDGDARQGQRAGQPEDPGHPDEIIEHGTQHQGQGKGDTDAHADHRHGLHAVVLLGEVCGHRHHGGGNGAAALERTAQDNPPDAVGQGCDHTADGENQKPADDHRLAADAVGQHAERDLQQGLGQAVGADGKTHQDRRKTFQILRIQGKDGQNEEQSQHAQGEYPRQGKGRPALQGRHAPGIYNILVHGHLVRLRKTAYSSRFALRLVRRWTPFKSGAHAPTISRIST